MRHAGTMRQYSSTTSFMLLTSRERSDMRDAVKCVEALVRKYLNIKIPQWQVTIITNVNKEEAIVNLFFSSEKGKMDFRIPEAHEVRAYGVVIHAEPGYRVYAQPLVLALPATEQAVEKALERVLRDEHGF